MASFSGTNQKSGTPVKYICCVAGFLLIGIIAVLSIVAIGGFGGKMQLSSPGNFAQTGGGIYSGTPYTGTGPLTYPDKTDSTNLANCLDEYIKSKNAGQPLIGTGKFFVESGKKYNVNPALVLAVTGYESIWGTSLLAREDYNFGGLSCFKCKNYDGAPGTYNLGGYRWCKACDKLSSNNRVVDGVQRPANEGGYYIHFLNSEEGIYEKSFWLSDKLKQGYTTIPQIGPHWAADYKPWIPAVTNYYNEILKKCPELANTK